MARDRDARVVPDVDALLLVQLALQHQLFLNLLVRLVLSRAYLYAVLLSPRSHHGLELLAPPVVSRVQLVLRLVISAPAQQRLRHRSPTRPHL